MDRPLSGFAIPELFSLTSNAGALSLVCQDTNMTATNNSCLRRCVQYLCPLYMYRVIESMKAFTVPRGDILSRQDYGRRMGCKICFVVI
jgi:hypothetical protein